MKDADHHTTIELFDALAQLSDKNEAMRFILDLCTPQEIKALKERWKVAQLLDQNELSYRQIHAITGASLTTIGRVARFLREEHNQGYQLMLYKFRSLK
ncbi:Helix-turn-helix transcriptional regulator [Candidatus Trichorickettsia mobilis]|uniref:Helix-turn-helix transcriptional regulator n=1 Tax=Candidatus Trichorickettsia mobilis TaxID=1346319 RepID=A0ABZ0UUP5_9RICK|nr:YerC/YecD family TrpR-related protein [Candidatus Trichorickettsia mobilis]WPY00624.1 Helix-turn-helix transcriptional regulator [Candidatus Trichorickettsia mobilis]